MNESLRDDVRRRANNCCEYCGIAQWIVAFPRHHVEHVRPKKHGGNDGFDNLALACTRCNLHKGSNLTGIDPVSQAIVVLFNPRQDDWETHFQNYEGVIIGRTPIGRATVAVLNVNTAEQIALRRQAN